MMPALRHEEAWLAPFVATATQPWDRAAAAHLLRRAAIAHPSEWIERVLELGPRKAAAWLVAGEEPDSREKCVLAARRHAVANESGDDLAAWWWARMLVTKHPLQARLSLFWHDHFATSIRKVRSSYWMSQQLAIFDDFGLGRFGELLVAISKSPAMLRWLDNVDNKKGAANENFARELFELFALGRDKYSEKDIQEAARAFTGWRIRREAFYFDGRRHDRGSKTVFGESGRFGGEQVIDLCIGREAHNRFLAEKLLRCFVGPEFPKAALDETAALWRKERGHVGKVLEVLLASRLFYAKTSRRSRIRGPVEYGLWALRTLGCRAAPSALHRVAGRMGQSLLDPPDVSGWDEEEAWVSSATWLHRGNFAGQIGRGDKPYYLRPGLHEVVPRGRPAEEVEFLSARLFPEGIAEDAKARLVAQAESERRVAREVRLAGLLRGFLLLPDAHRF